MKFILSENDYLFLRKHSYVEEIDAITDSVNKKGDKIEFNINDVDEFFTIMHDGTVMFGMDDEYDYTDVGWELDRIYYDLLDQT